MASKKSSSKNLFDDNILVIFLFIFYVFSIYLFLYSGLFFQSSVSVSSSLSESDSIFNVSSSLNSAQITLCSNISNSNKYNSCLSKYSDCLDDLCFYNKAVSSFDSTLCSNIVSLDLSLKCNLVISHDKIFQDSVLRNDVSYCNTLTDNLTVVACRNNFYFVQAYNLGNFSLCDKITEEVYKNACKYQ